MRKIASAMLIFVIALWAEAGLALVQGDQVMQCSMSMHQMQAMGEVSCCPMDEVVSPHSAAERPPCCSISNQPERPLGFLVSGERVKASSLVVLAVVPDRFAAWVNSTFRVKQGTDRSSFLKPVLELKTDLRI